MRKPKPKPEPVCVCVCGGVCVCVWGCVWGCGDNPFNSKFSFTPCRLHPASNGNSISESHPEYEGHAHHYVITITSYRGPNGGSSALPRPSSYTAAPRRTAPGHSNLCPSYLTTLITIHSSYGCLVKKKEKKKEEYVKDRCDELERSASHFLGPTDHF